MLKKIFFLCLVAMLFMLPGEVFAQREKVGWVGPVYKELSDSLMKGFKDFIKEPTEKI